MKNAIAIVVGLLLIYSSFSFVNYVVDRKAEKETTYQMNFPDGYKNPDNADVATTANNVSEENGKQIITITAKGGYSPRTTSAKAGMPTLLRFTTNGTFDCSSYVRVPSLKITKVLPNTGQTDIDIGTSMKGNLVVTCGMGMYSFVVTFN